MRAQIPEKRTLAPMYEEDAHGESLAYPSLLQPLLEQAAVSEYLIAGSVGGFSVRREVFQIPRFIFMGPKGGGDTIKLGLFATLHGDESEGAETLVELFQHLERSPEVARGFHLYAYPICNPGGFSTRTRHNLAGLDLAGQFWRESSQPEIYYLEREMGVHKFQGVISLHTARTSNRFSAFCRSSVLNEALVRPALEATRKFIPGLSLETAGEDDFAPTDFLTVTEELRPAPFEINLRIAKLLPAPSRIHGSVAALKSLLNSYRSLKAFGQNI